ncbi:MAG: protein TolR [Gammaproteobacteria bacterium]|jgi:biopolymer transport protein TolR|nr:protein TolR [Gammaproteobacteria bacterium]
MAEHTQRRRRKPMSEINVVPYIDVMLVLLIIFMVTAPMLTQGVQVDLPQASANPVEPSDDNSEPLIVSVDASGLFYIGIGDQQDKPIASEALRSKVSAVLGRSPNTPVMVKGDTAVDYGRVVALMALLQDAGAPSVGLITQPTEQSDN